MGILHLISVDRVRTPLRNYLAKHGACPVGRSRGRTDRRRTALANLQHIRILGADLPRRRGLEESAVSIQQMVFGKV